MTIFFLIVFILCLMVSYNPTLVVRAMTRVTTPTVRPVPTSTPFLTVKDAYNIYNMYCGRDYTCRVCGSVHHRNTRNDNYNPTSCYNLFRITQWDGSKDEVHVTYVKGEDTITIQYTDDVVHTLSLHAFFALMPYHSDGCSNLGMGLDEEKERLGRKERYQAAAVAKPWAGSHGIGPLVSDYCNDGLCNGTCTQCRAADALDDAIDIDKLIF